MPCTVKWVAGAVSASDNDMSPSPFRVDAHQHFWNYSTADYGWIDDSMKVLRRDFLPQHLSPILQQHGMDGSVAVQARQSEQETDWLLQLAADNASVLGVVGWIDLCDAALQDKLSRFKGNGLLKGFRHVLQDEPDDDFMLRTEFINGVEKLNENGYCYDILVFSRQLHAVEKFVSRLPPLPLVVDHIAKPVIVNGEWEPWAGHMARLARHQHVYCKLSGMVTEADWGRWTPATFEKYIRHVFECFGPDRVMFGSDWPVCTVAAEYHQVLKILDEFISRTAPESRNAVFGETAAAFYQL